MISAPGKRNLMGSIPLHSRHFFALILCNSYQNGAMTPDDRKKFKNEVGQMAKGMGGGIDIDTPFHWSVEGVDDPIIFFRHLHLLLPADSVLYVEGTTINPKVIAFYEKNKIRETVDVIRDTIFPVPSIFHFKLSLGLEFYLKEFDKKRPVHELFDHIKAYRGNSLLLTFHDAFCGCLQISERVPESSILVFCRALNVIPRREKTEPRDTKLLSELFKRL